MATIQENEKAEKMYKKAIESNKTAVKLSSTRPDIFQMKVGNLSPGASGSDGVHWSAACWLRIKPFKKE